MLAEGLLHHFEDLSPAALDRVRGAQALGLAMGYSTIVALASAWKAHIEFEHSDFESMVSSVELSLRNIATEEHDAHARLAIVLANAFMIVGDREQAQLWFRHGHRHSVTNGDQASIDALVYNRAAFLIARLRALNCKEPIPTEDLIAVRMEVASAKNLQSLIRLGALESHVRLLDARLQIVESKYESAISALQAVRGEAPFAPHNFDQRFIELEICFCQMMLGQCEAALTHLPRLSGDEFSGLDIDEQVIAAWMLGKMASIDARVGLASDYWSHFEVLWSRYAEMCNSLTSRLSPFGCQPTVEH
jgi:ATP/maltotriose-dependent transcriptional regulator MalT